jgi:hypothetical protein
MSALISRYGENSVTFINGDEQAQGVINTSGQVCSLREKLLLKSSIREKSDF